MRPSRRDTPLRGLGDVRSVILLAGQVGRSPLADGAGRSLLDLPVGDGRRLIDLWAEQLEECAAAHGIERIAVCISVDRGGRMPELITRAASSRVDFSLMRDPTEYRGTAGVVSDLTRGYDGEARVLVAAAHQVIREPLARVVGELARHDEAVSIVPHTGGELAGMFLLRCARLHDVAEVGFVDLKEQAIPGARGHGPLHAVHREPGASLPIRTLEEYIDALRAIHAVARGDGPRPAADPFAETWEPAFAIVEPGAQVGDGAFLQDSVVLDGAVVGRGAILARSLVCSGAVVPAGECVVDRIVTGRP
jgi:hypothetical protein